MDNPKEQFSLIYDQHVEKIYRFIYVKVDSRETAEDLTSRVFMKGWESYQKGQKVTNPTAFLYQIARNTVIDYYRQKDKKKTVSIDRVAQVSDPGSDIYQEAVMSADVELVRSAIGKLKPDYQDVLIWYYLEDMSADTIATLMAKPAGSVRVMIHRALVALKDELVQES